MSNFDVESGLVLRSPGVMSAVQANPVTAGSIGTLGLAVLSQLVAHAANQAVDAAPGYLSELGKRGRDALSDWYYADPEQPVETGGYKRPRTSPPDPYTRPVYGYRRRGPYRGPRFYRVQHNRRGPWWRAYRPRRWRRYY